MNPMVWFYSRVWCPIYLNVIWFYSRVWCPIYLNVIWDAVRRGREDAVRRVNCKKKKKEISSGVATTY
jgi:hypothetical protein